MERAPGTWNAKGMKRSFAACNVSKANLKKWHKLFTKTQSITFRAKSPKSTALATTTASVLTVSTHPYMATAPLQFPHQNEHGVTYSPKYAQPLATVWWTQIICHQTKLALSDKPSTRHSISMSGTWCAMKSKASNNHWCSLRRGTYLAAGNTTCESAHNLTKWHNQPQGHKTTETWNH